MTISLTTEPTVDIVLTPRQQQELRVAFQRYVQLKAKAEEAAAAVDGQKATLGRLRARIGEDSVGLDGFKVTLVQGTQSRLNKRKLRLVGVTQAQIDQATVTSPRKPYELVTCPGEQKRPTEDDE